MSKSYWVVLGQSSWLGRVAMGKLPLESEDWEAKEGWEVKVCEPIIKLPLAPREARGLLYLIGAVVAEGIPVIDVYHAIKDMYDRKKRMFSGPSEVCSKCGGDVGEPKMANVIVSEPKGNVLICNGCLNP